MSNHVTSTRINAAVAAAAMAASFACALGGAASAAAAPRSPMGCAPDPHDVTTKGAVSYQLIEGLLTGTHNTGSQASPIEIDQQTTQTHSTTVSAGASFGVDFGIAEVKADLSITVQKTFAKSTTVKDTFFVPPHQWGSLGAYIQNTAFVIKRYETTPQCGTRVTNLGTLHGITKVPEFLTCHDASHDCTPHG